jgi:hypothetical protein
MTASCAYEKRRPIFTAETQRRREKQEELKKNRQPENAEMAESAEKTFFFFNSLRLCVSAVIFRSWRGAARDFSPRRGGGAEKTLFFNSLRLCVSAVMISS